ncbi:monocarboxylate transporter 12-like [Haemaphysalis longicornis]
MGLLAAIFAPDIPWMAATFGMLHGAGVGIVLIAITVSIMTNFDKYRGVAAGLKYTGNSLSSLVLPKTLSVLGEAYSLRGTLLVYAGLCMNTTALMLFLKESKPRRAVLKVEKVRQERGEMRKEDGTTTLNERRGALVIKIVEHGSLPKLNVPDTAKRRGSLAVAVAADAALTLSQDPNTRIQDPHLQDTETNEGTTFALFARPVFYALVLGALVTDYTVVIVHGTILDYALDKGVGRSKADLSMTYCSPAIFVGRLLLPLAADVGLIRRTALAAVCLVCMAGSALALPHTTSFIAYISVQVCLALFLSCLATLKSVLAADCFGAGAVPIYYGANGVALVPVLLANPAITGYFRDETGSYDNLFRLVAGLQGITSAIYLGIAYNERKQDHRREPKCWWSTNL